VSFLFSRGLSDQKKLATTNTKNHKEYEDFSVLRSLVLHGVLLKISLKIPLSHGGLLLSGL